MKIRRVSDRPKISVLIPVYNVEKYIGRCIDSILSQSFEDFEIIIVNDASPDRSIEIVREYQKKDPRIRIIDKERNEGLMMARHTGYHNAKGQYVFFCDSDDFLPEDSLSELYNKALETGAEIIVGNHKRKFEKGGGRFSDRATKTDSIDHYKKAILTGTTPSLCGTLFKTDLLQRKQYVAFINHNFSEDRILLIQLLEEATSIATTEVISYVYYLNSGSMTQNRLPQKRLKEQIFALSWCYEWNKRYPELEFLNNRWILKYMSLYIESGYNVVDLLNPDIFPKDYLSFKSLYKYLRFRLSIHTFLCMHSKPYQYICAKARLIIRNIRNQILG